MLLISSLHRKYNSFYVKEHMFWNISPYQLQQACWIILHVQKSLLSQAMRTFRKEHKQGVLHMRPKWMASLDSHYPKWNCKTGPERSQQCCRRGKFLTSFPVFITWRRLPSAHSIYLLSLEAGRLVHFRMTEKSVTDCSLSCFRSVKYFGSSCKTVFCFREMPPTQCKLIRYTQEPSIDRKSSNHK